MDSGFWQKLVSNLVSKNPKYTNFSKLIYSSKIFPSEFHKKYFYEKNLKPTKTPFCV